MADETEAGRSETRIEDEHHFAQWLTAALPPLDICVALAARAALRGLPFIVYLEINNSLAIGKTIERAASRMFRATAVSWITAKYPGSIRRHKFNVDTAKNSVVAEAAYADLATSNLIWAAVNATKTAVSVNSILSNDEALDNSFALDVSHLTTSQWLGSETHKESYNAVESAAKGIVSVVTHQAIKEAVRLGFFSTSNIQNTTSASATNSKNSAEKAIWRAVELDVLLISSGASACQLADTPLWHNVPYQFVLDSWRRLAVALPDLDGWWVWKNWYEDILNGRAHSEAHDMIYATVPVEEWDKGPAEANAWIAARLAVLNEFPPEHLVESFEKLIQQDPHGASFEIVEGKARIAATLDENDAKVAEDPQTIQLHERVKKRANSALERVRRLANQPGFESIAQTVEEYYNYISGDTLSVAANISTVWELSVAIGSFIERDDEIRAGRGGMVSEMDAYARETLDQLVIASAPFVRRFPTARQNDDDVRLFKQSRTNFDSAKRIFGEAVNENLIEHDSNTIINIAIYAAENSSGIQSEKSVSWLNFTAGNLTKVLISAVFLTTAIPIKVASGYLDKLGEKWYEHSPGGKKALNFLLKNDKHITDLFSDSPPDLKAAHKNVMNELKKSHQLHKHHRK